MTEQGMTAANSFHLETSCTKMENSQNKVESRNRLLQLLEGILIVRLF